MSTSHTYAGTSRPLQNTPESMTESDSQAEVDVTTGWRVPAPPRNYVAGSTLAQIMPAPTPRRSVIPTSRHRVNPSSPIATPISRRGVIPTSRHGVIPSSPIATPISSPQPTHTPTRTLALSSRQLERVIQLLQEITAMDRACRRLKRERESLLRRIFSRDDHDNW
ncbi:hypothetical protein BDZ97DRAFT_2078536 [Flammula alnicola]|nr:hypothetical protein BDZ97DRAFT_2078536 [Flammula alnicola]